MEYFLDTSRALSFPEVASSPTLAWKTAPVSSLRFGPGAGHLWIRLPGNSFREPHEETIAIAYPSIERATAHYMRGSEEIRSYSSGLNVPFDERPVRSFEPVFPLIRNEGWDSLYLEVWTGAPLQAPLVVASAAEVRHRFETNFAIFCSYAGFMLGTLILCGFWGAQLGRRFFWAYVIHIGVTAFTISMTHYHPTLFIAPSAPATWAPHAVMGLSQVYCLSQLFILATISQGRISFLQRRPFWAAALALYGSLGTLSLFSLAPWVIEACHATVLVAVLFILITAALHARSNSAVRLFLWAQMAAVAGVSLFALQSLGWLSQNSLTLGGAQIGTILEVSVLAFTLQREIKKMALEREQMRESQLREQQARIALEEKHSQRLGALVELGKRLRKATSEEEARRIVQQAEMQARPLAESAPSPLLEAENDGSAFLESMNEALSITLQAIAAQQALEKEVLERARERMEFAMHKLRDMGEISDKFNNAFMALLGLLDAVSLEFRKARRNALPSANPSASEAEIWARFEKEIGTTLSGLKKVSSLLSELRDGDAHLGLETTQLLTGRPERSK